MKDSRQLDGGTAKKFRHRVPQWREKLGVIVCLLLLPFVAGAQSKTVTLQVKEMGVEEIILELRQTSGYRFLFNHEEVKDLGAKSIDMQNAPIEDVMEAVLEGTGMTFRIENDVIVIQPKQPTGTVKEVRVQGQVRDEQGQPLPGVTVVLKGTTIGGATDIDGHFSFDVPGNNDITLVFSFVGMETQEIAYNGESELQIVMAEDSQQMEEVVVTGIFERKKEGFTGSATTVNSEEIQRLTSTNVLKALEMLDPSFKMNVSNLGGANPNVIPDFQMRGSASMGDYTATDVVTMRGDVNSRPNQPLFVLDGVIGVEATTIMDLDPGQVESITLLKDAAATVIYGSQAANGVVVVETKAPEAGKLRFTYTGNYMLEMPDLTDYNLTNAKEKLQVEEIAGYYDAKNDITQMRYYAHLQEEIQRGVNTYWLSKPLRTAFHHRHGIQFEGGDKALRYKVYLGANWQPGVMKETNLNTKTGKVDLLYRFDKFLISNQLSIDYSKGARSSAYGDFSEYTLINPYYRPYDENHNIQKVLDDNSALIGFYGTPTHNPLWNTQFGYKDESQDFQMREALRLEYNPMESMRFSLDFTLTRSNGTVENFKSAQNTEFDTGFDDPALKGTYSKTRTEATSYRLSLTGSYNKAWGDQLLSAFAQYSINESVSDMDVISMRGFPSDKLDEIYLGTEFSNITGSESTARALGFVATLNYSYKSKYAVDFSGRLDASSQFGKDNRVAPFWSAGLRWNLEKEGFVKNWGLFDELILRTSYGVTGSQDFSPYQALQAYDYTGMMKTYLSFDVVGAKLNNMGNPNLKWQKTKEWNAALDFTMFKNFVSAKFEYYDKRTENTLLDLSLAPSVGFSTVKENLGTISNKGYEVSLRLMPYSDPQKQAYWNLTVNGAHNKSKIEQISNALKYQNEKQISNEEAQNKPLPRYEEGYSQTIIWAVPSMGIDPISGQEVFLKRDGRLTGVWNAADQIPCGDTEPKFSGTYNTTFQYKGLGVTIGGTFKWGGQIFNQTLLDKVENANLRMNVDRRVLTDRWKQPGDKAFFTKLDGDVYREPVKASSRFVMDESEFTLNTINLTYRMDAQHQRFLEKAGIDVLTVGMYMQDLVRISTIKMERGINYPFSRAVSLSLNVVF